MARPAAIQPVANDLGKINMILYGEPGVGKSVLACSGEKTLILASDSEETVSAAALGGSTADRWVVPDYSAITDAYEYLRYENHGYKWVWLDNATLFQEQGMDDIMTTLVAAKPGRNRFIPDKAEYLQNQQRLGVWIREMKLLEFNFGLVCHVQRREDPDTGDITMLPLLSGKQGEYAEKICGYMNVVCYMTRIYKDKAYHTKLHSNKVGKYYAKDRFSAIGTLTDPTIPQIEKLIGAKARPLAPKASGTRKVAAKKAPARKVAARKAAASK